MTAKDVLRLRPELTKVEAWAISQAVNRRLGQIMKLRLAEIMAGPYKEQNHE